MRNKNSYNDVEEVKKCTAQDQESCSKQTTEKKKLRWLIYTRTHTYTHITLICFSRDSINLNII